MTKRTRGRIASDRLIDDDPIERLADEAEAALAEIAKTTLLTADARLAGAPGPRCPIELLT